ncbi:MAG: Maf family protein [Gammaproteobacteria bacterium]|nr:MAG: Maf family protein [Gammaproteobacteria bacterium]
MTTSSPSPPSFVYLASASPRRRELLRQIGVQWQLLPARIDESSRAGEAAADVARRLALDKAREAASRVPPDRPAPVLAADTVVTVAGELLGKPADEADGMRMLRLLSGRTHEVFSAVAVISGDSETQAVSRTEVVFRKLAAEEISAYWRSGEPADKAGGYAIQGLGAMFVRGIRGSYSGVMGLPLFETAELLVRHGWRLWSSPRSSA